MAMAEWNTDATTPAMWVAGRRMRGVAMVSMTTESGELILF